jgi:RNA polymerase sigma-70 factor (ECF subfamily)
MELYQLLNKQGADYIRNDKAVVLKIARRKIARYYSLLERMRIFVPLTSVNDNGDEVMLSDLEASDFLTEDFAINKVLIDKARQIIAEKPLDVRKVFYLFYDVDLTIPEIAKELSMTESNVKHKLYRTLKELRKLL